MGYHYSKQFSIKEYVLDKERLKNGSVINKNYFDELLEEIRKIRASERLFYQKITDIYTTAIDFASVQNKPHFVLYINTLHSRAYKAKSRF